MKQINLKEWQVYSYDELSKIFIDEKSLKSTLKLLLQKNIFKKKKAGKIDSDEEIYENSLLIEDEVFEGNYSDYEYYTEFVGIIIVGEFILKIYPKYFSNEDNDRDFVEIIDVLKKHSSRFQNLDIFYDLNSPEKYNQLAVEISIMKDFLENGIYQDSHKIIEKNGNGEILWGRTINEITPYIVDNTPYYFETITRRNNNNQDNFFKRLHETIVTSCFKKFNEMGLLDIFSMPNISISNTTRSDFGEDCEILYKLESEINVQFSSRRKHILNLMYVYIAKQNSLEKYDEIGIFATRKFNVVWEDVLREVLENDYDKKISTTLGIDEYCEETFQSFIERPSWNIGENSILTNTFKLDILKISDNKKTMNIYDAKYYLPNISNNTISGQPGIQDISKQFCYELAFKELKNKSLITDIKNYFIMPKTQNIEDTSVSMSMFNSLGLGDIKVKFVDPKEVFKAYLSGSTLNINSLS